MKKFAVFMYECTAVADLVEQYDVSLSELDERFYRKRLCKNSLIEETVLLLSEDFIRQNRN
jgi:hypothetical protein